MNRFAKRRPHNRVGRTCHISVLAAALSLVLLTACFGTGCAGPQLAANSYQPVAWYWENPKPTGQGIKDMWGSGPNDVWAVGKWGAMYHYNGTEWEQHTVTPIDHFWAVWGTASNNVYAAATYDILHYDGSAWSVVFTASEALSDIHGSSPDNIWATGWYTRVHYDGANWTEHPTVSEMRVYVVSPNEVYTTSMGPNVYRYDGSSWQSIGQPPGSVNAFWAAGPNDVYAVGQKTGYDGFIAHYDGSAWTEVHSQEDRYFESIWGSGPNDIFAVGYNRTSVHFDGTSWTPQTIPRIGSMMAAWGSGPNDVFVAGGSWSGIGGGYFAHFDGSTWSVQSRGTRTHLNDVWAASDQNVFAVGEDGLILHNNGGCWWPMDSGTDKHLVGVHGSSATNIYAVGDETILRFNGSQWSPVGGDWTGYSFTDVWVGSNNDVFVGEWDGRVQRFDGSTWHEHSLPYPSGSTGIWGTSPTNVYTIRNYTVYQYTGMDWDVIYTAPTGGYFRDIWGTSENDIWVSSSYGGSGIGNAYLHHFDGTAWTQTLLSDEQGYTYWDQLGVWGRAPDDVWIVGLAGKTWHYDGAAWSNVPSATRGILWKVGGGATTTYAVGRSGQILRYGAAGAAAGNTQVCYGFSDLAADGRWDLSESFITDGIEVHVVPFLWSNGTWAPSGHVRTNGSSVNPRNVSLEFELHCDVQQISFSFEETGGTVNIRVNGEHREADDFNALNGVAVGGVQLNVISTLTGNTWRGYVGINGTVSQFEVGGQELHIDDVCFVY